MKKGLMITLIVAGALVVTGGIVFAVALSTDSFVSDEIKNNKEITDSFENIDVDLAVFDVNIIKSDNDTCKVESIEREKYYSTTEVKDNTLYIRYEEKGMSYFEKASGLRGRIEVNLSIPNKEYKDINIKTSTGSNSFSSITCNNFIVNTTTGSNRIKDVCAKEKIEITSSTGSSKLENVETKDLKVEATTGSMYLENIKTVNGSLHGTTGSVNLNNYIGSEHLKIDLSTGSVKLLNSDSNTLNIHTSTGSVRGNILTEKQFVCNSRTGSIDVPSTSGPKCEIETSTGSISIRVGKE